MTTHSEYTTNQRKSYSYQIARRMRMDALIKARPMGTGNSRIATESRGAVELFNGRREFLATLTYMAQDASDARQELTQWSEVPPASISGVWHFFDADGTIDCEVLTVEVPNL